MRRSILPVLFLFLYTIGVTGWIHQTVPSPIVSPGMTTLSSVPNRAFDENDCYETHSSSSVPNNDLSRRDWCLRTGITMTAIGFSTAWGDAAWAKVEDSGSSDRMPTVSPPSQKPNAPIEQLLPAARVKWNIERANQVAQSLVISHQTAQKEEEIQASWEALRQLLLTPQDYTRGAQLSQIPAAPAKAYLDKYNRNRQKLNPLARPGALLVQSGEIDTWKRLKRQERQREAQDEIRAALNAYTSSLNFRSDAYLLNVPSAERKQMIRQDRLPDVSQVIQSDMGLRYLYRNELLTAMQEVRDELEYQLRLGSTPNSSEVSASSDDLLELLQKATIACNEWFSLIGESDVQEAMEIVQKEAQAKASSDETTTS